MSARLANVYEITHLMGAGPFPGAQQVFVTPTIWEWFTRKNTKSHTLARELLLHSQKIWKGRKSNGNNTVGDDDVAKRLEALAATINDPWLRIFAASGFPHEIGMPRVRIFWWLPFAGHAILIGVEEDLEILSCNMNPVESPEPPPTRNYKWASVRQPEPIDWKAESHQWKSHDL